PTFWERYKSRILGVLGLFALQLALIVTLLVEHRRRRKAIVGLSESEARYRNVVDAQSELICRFLPDTTITFANDAYCRYFGKMEHELVGMKFVLLLPESERESTLRYVESLAENPRIDTREHPVIRADGSCSWHQWTNSVISSGGRIEMQGVGRDISARKDLEQQLVQSEREFSTLVENSPDVICRLNRDGYYIYVSPNLAGIFGLAAEAFVGKRPSEAAVPDYDSTDFESKCRDVINNRRIAVCEWQYCGRHYRTRIIPEYDVDLMVESLMTITEDFTERRRA